MFFFHVFAVREMSSTASQQRKMCMLEFANFLFLKKKHDLLLLIQDHKIKSVFMWDLYAKCTTSRTNTRPSMDVPKN